jgi:hypothetical protein
MSGHTPWSEIPRKAREQAELPPGPPADAEDSVRYFEDDESGIPVSDDGERVIAWDRPGGRPYPSVELGTCMPIDRARFDELVEANAEPPD